VFSSLKYFAVLTFIIFSYDIVCQWFKKLWARHSTLPEGLQFDRTSKAIRYVIPKFHLQAHNKKCHTTFSLNFLPGSGRTDGEGIERDWAIMNAAANSTKEMSEGSRHDTLDDLWGDWNYRKILMMRKSYLQSCIP